MAVVRQAFTVYVACNMAVCAIVFAPWALPRETISGLLGRWMCTEKGWKYRIARPLVVLADRMYFWEQDHCREVYLIEQHAREILYP